MFTVLLPVPEYTQYPTKEHSYSLSGDTKNDESNEGLGCETDVKAKLTFLTVKKPSVKGILLTLI